MNKQCQYILLPTDKSSSIHLEEGGLLMLYKEVNYYFNTIPQHLYILSDDEIKKGDWFIVMPTKQISKCEGFIGKNSKRSKKSDTFKKIIATTDPELKLPSISQSDIEYIISLYNGKEVEKPILSLSSESMMSDSEKIMFKSGYDQCLQDNTDKKFTLDEMKKAMLVLVNIPKSQIADGTYPTYNNAMDFAIQSITKEQSNDTVMVEYECDEWIPELGVSDPISYKLKLKDGHIVIH